MKKEREEKKGFAYWFKNVFWYHYGKLSIVVLFLLITAVWFTVDALKKEKYDLNVAIITDRAVARSDAQALGELLASAAGDVDGNGKKLTNVVTVNLGAEDNREETRYQQLLYLSLPEYTIFLMNDAESARYAGKEDTFQPLADYGIDTPDETGRRIFVGDLAIIRDLCGEDCYACLADWTVDGKGSAKLTEASVRALKALLASPRAGG